MAVCLHFYQALQVTMIELFSTSSIATRCAIRTQLSADDKQNFWTQYSCLPKVTEDAGRDVQLTQDF